MSHPYAQLPDSAFWRRAVARVPLPDVDPLLHAAFRIAPEDRVATAGSCFAQNIARHLKKEGYHYFVTETAHEILPEAVAASFNYGTFSARFGNIYTARQLIQLLERAYGDFVPNDDVWCGDAGHLIDPYRPLIQPHGFVSTDEFYRDREQHFSAVRHMIEQMDVFVFTFGLTECWVNADDGATYPLCPGTAAGVFDAEKHLFLNQGFEQVVADFSGFIARVRELNPTVRFILTVSPVPLVATAADRHVLVSNCSSKAVLRVAAERLTEMFEGVAYFPSYEIITGLHAIGAEYFSREDARSVIEAGVEHVMRVFFRHFGTVSSVAHDPCARLERLADEQRNHAQHLVEALCDETVLDRLVDKAG